MANGNIFAFLAGIATGAVLISLAGTQKGSEAFENGRAAVLNGLDKLEEAIASKTEE